MIYTLANVLAIPSVQLELRTMIDTDFISPSVFVDYFNSVCFPVSC